MNQPYVYAGVTEAQLARVLSQLSQSGTTIVKNSGSGRAQYDISGKGVHCSAVYQGNMLTVSVLDKPFFIPESMIHSQLSEALQNAGWKP